MFRLVDGSAVSRSQHGFLVDYVVLVDSLVQAVGFRDDNSRVLYDCITPRKGRVVRYLHRRSDLINCIKSGMIWMKNTIQYSCLYFCLLSLILNIFVHWSEIWNTNLSASILHCSIIVKPTPEQSHFQPSFPSFSHHDDGDACQMPVFKDSMVWMYHINSTYTILYTK